MGSPLEIVGVLSIHNSDLAAGIRADGREVVCDLPGLSSGLALLRLARQARRFALPLSRTLGAADVRLSIRIRGRIVAEAGPGIATGRLAEWMGLSGLRLRAFRRPSAR